MEYLRNKQTGEFQSVERDTAEWVTLIGQVGPDGRSLWEQTGSHDVNETAERAAEGAVRPEDLGKDDQPLPPIEVDTDEVGPAKAPWLELTAGEREAGLSDDQKQQEVADDIRQQSMDERNDTLKDAAERIESSVSDFPVERPERAQSGQRRRKASDKKGDGGDGGGERERTSRASAKPNRPGAGKPDNTTTAA